MKKHIIYIQGLYIKCLDRFTVRIELCKYQKTLPVFAQTRVMEIIDLH